MTVPISWATLAMAALLALPAAAQNTLPPSGGPLSVDASAAPLTLTLAQALVLALRGSPELAAASHEAAASAGMLQQAGARPNPSLSLTLEDRQRASRTSTLVLSQPIELGGKRGARVSAAERGRDLAALDLTLKQATLRAAVMQDYLAVQTAQEREQLARAARQLAEQASGAAEQRLAAGKISPVEASKASVALAGARIEVAQAGSELMRSRSRLMARWGAQADSAGPLAALAAPRTGALTAAQGEAAPELPPLAQLLLRAAQAPSLQRARMELARRQALTQLESARRSPDLTLSVGAKRDAELGRNQAVLGLSLPLPLFDTNQGNLREALSRSEQAREEVRAAELQLLSGLQQAHARWQASRDEAAMVADEILPAAISAHGASLKGFQFGKFNFLDVLDAQRSLVQARAARVRALAEMHAAAIDIQALLGISSMTPDWEQQ
ncbi:TolC family protein [Oxalobacteraceae bacterium]|nr:TolC family protein [Oxalobacteraceae bacterium]